MPKVSKLGIPYKSRTPEYQREWRKLNRGKKVGKCPWKLLEQRYGVTKEHYEQLLEEQGGSCAICSNTNPGRGARLHVDHDHISGKIRGLLCDKCNRGLGYFNDDPNLLYSARSYLESPKIYEDY